MAIVVNQKDASDLLERTLSEAEQDFHLAGTPLTYGIVPSEVVEKLFSSRTEVYREALLGCTVARCVDRNIDVRLPATEAGDNSFSGRTLADRVITPFFQEHGIPALASTYLGPLRGGARFLPGGEPRIQRDQGGYDALVTAVGIVAEASGDDARNFLRALLRRFVELREAANIVLARIARPNLVYLTRLIDGLIATKTGGRFSALLATAMFQTIAACHGRDWDVRYQGINVADKASGAVGDITIVENNVVLLGVEVTERTVDKNRVTLTFEQKVTPGALLDYLFITTTPPDALATVAARSYTAVGHEMNFVLLRDWLIHNLATIGSRCRELFQDKVVGLLQSQNTDLKILWNAQVKAAMSI